MLLPSSMQISKTVKILHNKNMKDPKGMIITARFGEIEIKIEDPKLDINNIAPQDFLKLIQASVKAVADQVIAIQKSLH